MILTVLHAGRIVRQAQQHFISKIIDPHSKQMCMQIYKILVKEGFNVIASEDEVSVFNSDGSITEIYKADRWIVERRSRDAKI